MTGYERDMGQILEGIKNLNVRYDNQENRLERVVINLGEFKASVAAQPNICLEAMEKRFITKEKFEPVESTCQLIRKASIYFLCYTIAFVAVVFAYIKELI